MEAGEKGRRWDVRREGFFHTVRGKGEMAKGIIVLRTGADPDVELRLLQDRMGVGRWVGEELRPALGPGVGFLGVLGHPATASKIKRSRSGCPAQLPREPGAGAACPGPVGLGLRAAGRGEENNRLGRAGAGGSGSDGRRGRPRLDQLRALGDPQPGALWVPEIRKKPKPPDLARHQLHNPPPRSLHASRAGA